MRTDHIQGRLLRSKLGNPGANIEISGCFRPIPNKSDFSFLKYKNKLILFKKYLKSRKMDTHKVNIEEISISSE